MEGACAERRRGVVGDMVAEGVFTTGNLSSYCSVDDVFKVLVSQDLDVWGGRAALEERVRELLSSAQSTIETASGRDFTWHPGDAITIDGNGTDRVMLTMVGVATPMQVKQVTVNGRVLTGTEWRAYPQVGMVRLTGNGQRLFTAGVQNVTVTVDWGYTEAPAAIALAQAKLVAAELLAELGGEGGTVRETRIGDYTVRYAEGGKYGEYVERLCAEALEGLKRWRKVGIAVI